MVGITVMHSDSIVFLNIRLVQVIFFLEKYGINARIMDMKNSISDCPRYANYKTVWQHKAYN